MDTSCLDVHLANTLDNLFDKEKVHNINKYSINVKTKELQLSGVIQHSAQKHPGIPPAGPGPSQMTSSGNKKFNVSYQYF